MIIARKQLRFLWNALTLKATTKNNLPKAIFVSKLKDLLLNFVKHTLLSLNFQ